MSESSVPVQSPLTGAAPFQASPHQYSLSDDLARLCLPQEWKDSYRTLAWVNSICFLFLLVGLVGIKAPKVIHKRLSELTENVPVVFTPPEEPPKVEPEVKPDEPDQPRDVTDAPTVAPVVAVVDSPAVAFSVPVQGAVAIAQEARLATPPPPVDRPPAKPVQFNPHAAGEGYFSDPQYPAMALRNHYEGTAIIQIAVDEAGNTTEAKIFKSSGFPILDEAALDVVKKRWRFPPGPPRLYHWPCTFKLQ
jgi:protein TonB